jgi:hypothetical protein
VYLVTLIIHKYIFSKFGDIQNMKVENLKQVFTVLAIVVISGDLKISYLVNDFQKSSEP